MPTRELVYQMYGRAAELTQLLETEIGTALLALDALETKSFLSPNSDAYLRLRNAIESQTLGKSLRQMRERLRLLEDLETVLSDALLTRNHLAHRFYPEHGLAIMEENGRVEMLKRLEAMTATLSRAYAIAGNVAQALVTGVQLMKAAHEQKLA